MLFFGAFVLTYSALSLVIATYSLKPKNLAVSPSMDRVVKLCRSRVKALVDPLDELFAGILVAQI